MSYTELGGLVLGSGLVAALISTLLHRIVHHDTFRRYHEVGYAVFLQLGVIFAVLLAFVFNGVWSDYNTASQAIDSECASLHGIAILSDRLPSPARDAILDDLRTYLTTGEKETRAWTIHAGDTAPKAAGVIHSDFERGFIKAETVAYDDLINCGSVAAAREKGLYRMEGKEYVVKDGDVMLFKFNV